MNHRFTPEFAVTRPLWFDQYLKKSFTFPETPKAKLILATDDHVPEFKVTTDAWESVAEVHIYYSLDPDPRARFWRGADSSRSGNAWIAKLPIVAVEQPLFAFANVEYRLPESESEPYARKTERYCLSSLLCLATSDDLKKAGVKATDAATPVIDDFKNGWRDWYRLEVGNPHHWEFSTRKLADPKWQGQPRQCLTLEVQARERNELIIVLTENFFRTYRGKSREFVAVVQLTGGQETQVVSLEADDFKTEKGETLTSWQNVDLLSLRAYHEKAGKLLGSKTWAGPQPIMKKLRWTEN
jgi:hypothetical protein